VAQMRSVLPDLKVILCAGVVSYDKIMVSDSKDIYDIVKKPYSKMHILRSIRESVSGTGKYV
jgi:DNA-binding NtrC family response regulator